MISSVNGSLIRGAYQEQSQKTKEQEKSVQSITKQGDTSRIEELKASIDIESLAKRIAQELT